MAEYRVDHNGKLVGMIFFVGKVEGLGMEDKRL